MLAIASNFAPSCPSTCETGMIESMWKRIGLSGWLRRARRPVALCGISLMSDSEIYRVK
jgi:hypothetical protein